jgi:hypothetical protein
MKALAKEPSQRHQSAAEFRAALKRLGPSFAQSAAVLEAVTAKAGGAVPRRWYPSLTWAVLAIAMFAVFFFMSGHQ